MLEAEGRVTRPVPMRAAGWRVDGGKKIHAGKRAAYYELAKRLVLEKYPPILGHEDGLVPEGWTTEHANSRFDKAAALFWTRTDGYEHFDSKKWTAFVRRVARFLMFVDAKRSLADVMRGMRVGLLPAEEHAMLQATLERVERESAELGELAVAIRAEIMRRDAEVPR